jgi:hypothetical protein
MSVFQYVCCVSRCWIVCSYVSYVFFIPGCYWPARLSDIRLVTCVTPQFIYAAKYKISPYTVLPRYLQPIEKLYYFLRARCFLHFLAMNLLQKKSKVCPITSHKTQTKSRVIALLSCLTSVLDGPLAPRQNDLAPMIEVVGWAARPPNKIPPPNCPVHCKSLYRLSYCSHHRIYCTHVTKGDLEQ